MLKSIENLCTGRTVHNVPQFRLSVLSFNTQSVRIARMHLHGQIIACIDQLDEQREIRKLLRIFAEHAPAFSRQPFLERLSLRRTVCNHALAVPMTGKFPTLGDLRQLCLFAVFFFQTRPAPEIILQRRDQFHRISHRSLPSFKFCNIFLYIISHEKLDVKRALR